MVGGFLFWVLGFFYVYTNQEWKNMVQSYKRSSAAIYFPHSDSSRSQVQIAFSKNSFLHIYSLELHLIMDLGFLHATTTALHLLLEVGMHCCLIP